MNNRKYFTGILILSVGWILFISPSCRKVDHNDAFLHTVYSVMNSGFLYRADGTWFNYSYASAASYASLVPGDTLTIAGVLGGNAANRSIKIGDSAVSVFNGKQFRIRTTSGGDTTWTNVDYFQCRIPAGVAGNNVPVTITINGIPIAAPALKIQQYTNIPSSTDTTLIVEKVVEWMPGNIDAYKNGYSAFDLWKKGTVTNSGNCWFFNQIDGVFKVAGGAVQQVLATGAVITPVNGNPFALVKVIGLTVDIDETVVYFSASTRENSADTSKYYITRLCRMDPASGNVTVLNRSVFMRPAASYPRAADLSTPLYDPSFNYLPAEGNMADVKLALGNLFLALDGSLFGENFVYRTITFAKSPLAGDPRFPQFSDPAFYAQRDSSNAAAWYAKGNISSGMNNFVRIRNGSVKSLAKPVADWPVPSLAVYSYQGQQISPDGKFIYDVNSLQATLRVISTDDLEQEVRGTPGYEFSFSSSDTAALTGWKAPTMALQQANFTGYYILSNGDGVFFPGGYGYPGKSLLGINFAKHNAYVYAGTENGLKSNDIPGQVQLTGLAKWVNFSPIGRGLSGKSTFIGFDRRNNLYFISTATEGPAGNVQPSPLEIYRIRKP